MQIVCEEKKKKCKSSQLINLAKVFLAKKKKDHDKVFEKTNYSHVTN